MYALERGLGLKWLGVLFAALAALDSFGIGCGTQINAIAEVIENNIPLPIPPIVVGIAGGLLTAVVIIGGAGGAYAYALNQNKKRKAAAARAAASRRAATAAGTTAAGAAARERARSGPIRGARGARGARDPRDRRRAPRLRHLPARQR